MVKRKEEPKKREKAGFAARTEKLVKDATQERPAEPPATNNSTEDESSEGGGGAEENENETNMAPSMPPPPPPVKKLSTKQLLKTKRGDKDGNQLTTQEGKIKKKRLKPGAKALKEIKLLQKTTDLCIPRAPFLRIIRQTMFDITNNPTYRITEAAVEALREASESVLVSVFEDSYLLALHAKRVTLFPRDMELLLRIRNDASLNPQ